MIFRIDTTSAVPVYAQIVEQVKRAVASGGLKSGDPLPSLRETAVKLRINPLTVSKAYKQLEQDGLIETRHGLGSFVTWNGVQLTDEYRRATLARDIDALLEDAYHLGVPFEEIGELLEERIRAANDGYAQDDNSNRSSEDGE